LTGDATYRWNTRLADHHFTATRLLDLFQHTGLPDGPLGQ
jgi:hypothetical protein